MLDITLMNSGLAKSEAYSLYIHAFFFFFAKSQALLVLSDTCSRQTEHIK